jgi:hypothetical protein
MPKIALFRTKLFQLLFAVATVIGVSISFAIDSDNDGMSDLYEGFFKLNPTNAVDAAENYDSDSLNNLRESELWTDPDVTDTDMDGFVDDADSNALSRAVIRWGDPSFTTGNTYSYTGPLWWLGAEKSGGEWGTNACWTVPAADTGAIYVDFDRSKLTNNLMMEFRYFNASNCTAVFSLVDTNGAIVATNLYGNIITDSDESEYSRFTIPLTNYPTASTLVLDVATGKNAFEAYTSIFSIDDDTDGLDSDQEIQVGTSDFNQDCDDDDLTDYAEVMITLTDPLKADTDEDGLSDGEELLESRYRYIPGAYNLGEARTLAEILGGYLARITNQEEHDAIAACLPDVMNSSTFWIGLNDEAEEGTFVWEDGTSLDYSNWNAGEPSDKVGKEDGVICQNGLWCDVRAKWQYGVLVEYDQPLNALNPDTDGDGLTDGEELNDYLSNPYQADSDGDGLSDAEELEMGTSAIAYDSDNDGLSDTEELVWNTDPWDSDSDDDGLSDGAEVAQLYYLSKDSLDWHNAKADAERQGGFLACITGSNEWVEVNSLLGTSTINQTKPWLGASDESEEGTWSWVTGEPFEFSAWRDGEPSILGVKGEIESYLQIIKGGWNDAVSNSTYAFIIEYEDSLNPLNPDSDGDGITDGDEVTVYFSNPHCTDTDGDGFTDLEELDRGTSPAKLDGDDDGLSDLNELVLGTDPLDSDSDDDGLSDGAETLQLYYLDMDPLSWHEAKAASERQNGYLAVITSEVEEAELSALIGGAILKAQKPWLGATDEVEEGSWLWVTDEVFEYSKWRVGEPSGGEEHYLSYGSWSDVTWNDAAGDVLSSYLVEYEDSLNPLNPDSDGDGITDGDEVTVYFSNPHCTDTDGDGFTDLEELDRGTSPAKLDGDDDGLSDLDELVLGTDPLNADTDGDGLTDGRESRFVVVKRLLSWPQAKAEAEARGGHLATITSEAEYNEVVLPTEGIDAVWIGLSDQRMLGEWEWVTGEPLDYTRWATNEPNSAMGEEPCASRAAEGWGDEREATSKNYLIEYPVSLDPLNSDADSDGLPDGDEVNIYLSNPFGVDTDGDGLTDGEEVALGLNPVRQDSDRDGLDDNVEIELGLDPTCGDMDADGLEDGMEYKISVTDPMMADTNTNGVNDLVIVQTIAGVDAIGWTEGHNKSTWSTNAIGARLNAINNFSASTISYSLDIAEAGIYHLGMQVQFLRSPSAYNGTDPQPEVYINDLEGITLQLNTTNSLPEYSMLTPWLPAGKHEILISLSGPSSVGSFTIEGIELGMINGEDADGNGVVDWMEAYLANGIDTDGDGISDADEVMLHGSNPIDDDTDGDGLIDGEELTHGTDILNADSDGDGVSDGQEVNGSLTNPLVAEFDGTMMVVDALNGAETNAALGEWTVEDSELKIDSVRGSVDYVMNFSSNDMCRLVINAAHSWNKSSCTPVTPIDTSAFLIYVDDIYVGKYPMVSADGVYTDVSAFLPSMPAGEHTVRLYWENVYSRLAVKIQSLELQSLGGPDANGNGTKDWIEVSISAMAGVDAVTESYISPACVEGDARYVEFMDLIPQAFRRHRGAENVPQASCLPRRGAGPRWYANLSLEQHGRTTATASFQNGALELPINIEWTALNLMEHDGETILIRKGDSVKFTALPGNVHGGQFTLSVFGDEHRSPNTRPLVVAFDAAGTYTVHGDYRKGNRHTQASITVEVIDGSFPAESPACLVGKERIWTFESSMPTNIVLEVDDTVEMTVSGAALITNNNSRLTVALKANDTNGDHTMLARLYPGGPVLDSVRLSPFWIQNAVDGYFYTVERYEDSELWEVRSVAKNVPDSVDIQIKVVVGGVTLDDYTLERWITNESYSDIGEYNFRLFHPDGAGSTCHTFKLYQAGELIGEAFGGGHNDIGEE